MTTPLISLDDVKEHLPIKATYTELDSRLELLILTATQQIETATDREFHEEARTERFGTPITASYDYDFTGSGSFNESGIYQSVRPARYTLKAINVDEGTLRVFYDPDYEFTDPDTEVEASNLILDNTKGLLTVIAPMIRTPAGLKVTYTAGYAANSDGNLTDTIPYDLKMACISQVLFLYTRLDPMNVGRQSEKKEGEGANMFNARGGLTPEAASLVSRYRAMLVGID